MSVGYFYGKVLQKVLSAEIDLTSDDLYCSLHGTGYAWDQIADEFFADTSDELTGTGYTAGGVLLTGLAFNFVDDDLALYVDFDDPTWVALTMTGVKYGVIRKDTGSSATDPLIAILELSSPEDVAGDDYSLVIPSQGLLALSVG